MYWVYILDENGKWQPFPTDKYGTIPAYQERETAEVEAARQSRLLENPMAAGTASAKTLYENGEIVGYEPPMIETINKDGYWEPIEIFFGNRGAACELAYRFADETQRPCRVGGEVILPKETVNARA